MFPVSAVGASEAADRRLAVLCPWCREICRVSGIVLSLPSVGEMSYHSVILCKLTGGWKDKWKQEIWKGDMGLHKYRS